MRISKFGLRGKKTKFQKWGPFRLSHSVFSIYASGSAGRRNPQSAIGIKGFTLIEIIILIVMAGVLLPAIIVPFATGIRGSTKPEMATTAIYLAHYKMEEFMKFDYSNPALNPIALTPYADSPIPNYQWQWEIVLVDRDFNSSGSDVGYKRVLVRVKDPQNDTYEIYSVVTRFP